MTAKQSESMALLDKMSSEVAPEISPLLRLLIENSRRIGLAVAVFVLAAAGYGVYTWHAGKQKLEAQNELGAILVVTDGAVRLERLQAFLPAAPAAVKEAVFLAIAGTAAEIGNYTAAADAWGQIALVPKSSLYVTAMVGKAENLSRAGKDAEALAALASMTIPTDSAATGLVNALVADLAEKTGDFAKAADACEKLVADAAINNPEEADFWRQKAAALRLRK